MILLGTKLNKEILQMNKLNNLIWIINMILIQHGLPIETQVKLT
jgi:hypothetical protein